MNDIHAIYERHQRIYKALDLKSREELLRIRKIINRKYDKLWEDETMLASERKQRLERIYAMIETRIGDTLKLWR